MKTESSIVPECLNELEKPKQGVGTKVAGFTANGYSEPSYSSGECLVNTGEQELAEESSLENKVNHNINLFESALVNNLEQLVLRESSIKTLGKMNKSFKTDSLSLLKKETPLILRMFESLSLVGFLLCVVSLPLVLLLTCVFYIIGLNELMLEMLAVLHIVIFSVLFGSLSLFIIINYVLMPIRATINYIKVSINPVSGIEGKNAEKFLNGFKIDLKMDNLMSKKLKLYGIINSMKLYILTSFNSEVYKNYRLEEINFVLENNTLEIVKACETSDFTNILDGFDYKRVNRLGEYTVHVAEYNKCTPETFKEKLFNGLITAFKKQDDELLKNFEELYEEFLSLTSHVAPFSDKERNKKLQINLLALCVVYFKLFTYIEESNWKTSNSKKSEKKDNIKPGDCDSKDEDSLNLHKEKMSVELKESKEYKQDLLKIFGEN